MTSDENDRPAGSYYGRGQLAAALRAAATHADSALRDKAEARASGWRAVLAHLASGALRIGQRQPFADKPTWVTPEVMRGGFASGVEAAGGPLLPHERALAQAIGKPSTESRLPLNGHHLTTEGLAALGAQLTEHRYRIGVPEEGALLSIRWLIERGELARAAELLELLEPYFSRLRFYPRQGPPLPTPQVGIETPVLAKSAHALAESLRKKTPSRPIEAMREFSQVWAPLTDAMVSLVLETIEGEAPHFEGELVVGGLPFTRAVADFEPRRRALLRDVEAARAQLLCTRPLRPSEVLGTLCEGLRTWPDLDADRRSGVARRMRHRLAGFLRAYGAPGSPRHQALRASQRVGPDHAALAHVLAARLEGAAEPGEGLSAERAQFIAHPITEAEAHAALSWATPLPRSLSARLRACEEAPLATLVDRNLVRSGEVLATLTPQVTGPALATRFSDPAARTLYAASYQAFRRRRSLLLLWLQHQARFSELPWIAALESTSDADPGPAVQETLRQLAAFAITRFPATPIPNKLVSELSNLARVVRSETAPKVSESGRATNTPSWLPLVEEIASDIFMGTFSLKFLRAAQIAAQLLGTRSLYARYYGIDYERVLGMHTARSKWNVSTSPDFDAYCVELAALPVGGNPQARHGAVIEQASILTTHNLAALTSVLELTPLLHDQWAALAEVSLVSVLDRLERRVLPENVPFIQRMRASKTAAFAWRQMLFYLSLVSAEALTDFVARADALLAARRPLAQERFGPVMQGLRIVARGGTFMNGEGGARRLLGWSVERPFLLGPRLAT